VAKASKGNAAKRKEFPTKGGVRGDESAQTDPRDGAPSGSGWLLAVPEVCGCKRRARRGPNLGDGVSWI
jgi:hypothetical protein